MNPDFGVNSRKSSLQSTSQSRSLTPEPKKNRKFKSSNFQKNLQSSPNFSTYKKCLKKPKCTTPIKKNKKSFSTNLTSSTKKICSPSKTKGSKILKGKEHFSRNSHKLLRNDLPSEIRSSLNTFRKSNMTPNLQGKGLSIGNNTSRNSLNTLNSQTSKCSTFSNHSITHPHTYSQTQTQTQTQTQIQTQRNTHAHNTNQNQNTNTHSSTNISTISNNIYPNNHYPNDHSMQYTASNSTNAQNGLPIHSLPSLQSLLSGDLQVSSIFQKGDGDMQKMTFKLLLNTIKDLNYNFKKHKNYAAKLVIFFILLFLIVLERRKYEVKERE